MEPRLTIDQVCAIYGVSRKAVWEWRAKLGMPYRRIGKVCYFLQSELEAWESGRRVNVVTPSPAPRRNLSGTGLSHIVEHARRRQANG